MGSKILQLKMVIEMRHGVMIVGPSGVGKSSALRTLKALYEMDDGVKTVIYTIDPKAVDKEGLYGVLDGTTLEWTDVSAMQLNRSVIRVLNTLLLGNFHEPITDHPRQPKRRIGTSALDCI